MFRNRYEELNDLIRTYELLQQESTNENSISKDIEIVTKFVENEIAILSNYIIEGMLEDKLFDYEFSLLVYKFNPKRCRKIFQDNIAKFYENFGFRETMSFASRCTRYFTFAIMSYEAIHKKIKSRPFVSKESFELSKQLHTMRSMESFQAISNELKTKVWNISKKLPFYVEDLPESSRVVIIPNHETGHSKALTLHHYKDEVFELQNDEGRNLCIELQSSSFLKFFQKWAEVDFVRGDATQMKIELYDKQDISKGYTIRTAADNFYLCASEDEWHSHKVSEIPKERTDDISYTWVFKAFKADPY